MNKYRKTLIRWALAATFLAPALGWTHGAVDQPISRAVNCQVTGGYWLSENGTLIVDPGCKASALGAFPLPSGRPSDWVYPAQQWNEVAHIPHINNPTLDQIKAIIQDEKICAAGDAKKASLDYPTPSWKKTNVKPGQPLTIRLIGTAPHVPSTFYAFATTPGFDTATKKLKWSDLIPLGEPERLTVANTNWQTPAAIRATGFFLITRTIPPNASGKGLIVSIWVRDDPAGEFFISCSDVVFGESDGTERWKNIGLFISPDMRDLKPGDKVHFRIFGTDAARTEVVDITQPITDRNLAPGQWGSDIAKQVNPAIAKIGELNNQEVTFNPVDPLINVTYATGSGYTQAMSIIPGGGPTPVNPASPVARITGPTVLVSGQAFTFDGSGSSGSNGQLLYQWAVPGMEGSQSGTTVTGKALTVQAATPLKARLNVSDQQNGKVAQVEFDFTVNPSGGGQQPDGPYVAGGQHEAGKIYSNNGKNYKCKYTSWCSGSPQYYEPGKGLAWQEAWDEQ